MYIFKSSNETLMGEQEARESLNPKAVLSDGDRYWKVGGEHFNALYEYHGLWDGRVDKVVWRQVLTSRHVHIKCRIVK